MSETRNVIEERTRAHEYIEATKKRDKSSIFSRPSIGASDGGDPRVYAHKDTADPFIRLQAIEYVQSDAIGITACIRARVPILQSAGMCIREGGARRGAGTLAVTDVCLSMHAGLDPTWFGTSVIYNHLRCGTVVGGDLKARTPAGTTFGIPFPRGNDELARVHVVKNRTIAPQTCGIRTYNNNGMR